MRKKKLDEVTEGAVAPAAVPGDSFLRMLGEREVAAGLRVEERPPDPYYGSDDDNDEEARERYNESSYDVEDITVSVDLSYRFALSNRGVSDQYTVPDGWVDPGDTVYVLIERYDDYDTFGSRNGLAKIHGVFATEAAAHAASTEVMKNEIVPRQGWGYTFRDLYVESTTVVG